MDIAKQMHALRHSVAWSRLDHVTCVRVAGSGAFALLDRACPSDLHLRDGQMLHSLLLDDRARVRADLYICRDDTDFILQVEGLSGAELQRHLAAQRGDPDAVELHDLSTSHQLLALDGPFAWELLGELVGPEVVGLPYLTFFHSGRFTCFRAGKSGEFGYRLLAPRTDAERLRQQILDRGPDYDLQSADLESLDQCALENWFFNVRREGSADLTPLELQLQWRVSYRKSYTGSAALGERRRSGPRARLTCLVADQPVRCGDTVRYDDQVIGKLLNAGYSHAREDWVAAALLDLPWAHPNIGRYVVANGADELAVRTVSPPVINNRSLHVNPQVHSYRTRHEHEFPSLKPGGLG